MKKPSIVKNILILLAGLLAAGCAGSYAAISAGSPDMAASMAESTALDHLNRGINFYVDDKNEEAIAEFDRAITLDNELYEAYMFRGAAYGNIGDFDRAIENFSFAIRLDPNDASAYHSLGIAYSAKDEWDHAIEYFSESIRLAPNYPVDYHNRGIAYSIMGEWNFAILDFETSLRIDPDQDNTRQRLEEALREHGR